MELAFFLMDPYHRLLRNKEWTVRDTVYAEYLNTHTDFGWTQYYRGFSPSVHLVAMELDHRIRGKDYTELSHLRERDYAQVYEDMELRTVEEIRNKRKEWLNTCCLPALVHRLLLEEP